MIVSYSEFKLNQKKSTKEEKIPFTPLSNVSFHCINFHEICKCSVVLSEDVLCRISHRSVDVIWMLQVEICFLP
jgi:hypothetical protein